MKTVNLHTLWQNITHAVTLSNRSDITQTSVIENLQMITISDTQIVREWQSIWISRLSLIELFQWLSVVTRTLAVPDKP